MSVRCPLCRQPILRHAKRHCVTCEKPIRRHDRWHFSGGMAMHNDCSNPTGKAARPVAEQAALEERV
jgi:hypothetical protein